ncbi:hypothetical protein HI914_04439 [Erysiphe necator]|nr:hypothetical protein HI914_04439 [Erysiphe necator]
MKIDEIPKYSCNRHFGAVSNLMALVILCSGTPAILANSLHHPTHFSWFDSPSPDLLPISIGKRIFCKFDIDFWDIIEKLSSPAVQSHKESCYNELILSKPAVQSNAHTIFKKNYTFLTRNYVFYVAFKPHSLKMRIVYFVNSDIITLEEI